MNILIADDHQVYRRGLRDLIQENHPEAHITEAATGQEVLRLLRQRRHPVPTDIAMIDLEMPDTDGIQTIDYLRDRMPDLKIIVVTMHEDPWFMNQLVGMGVHGYLLKGDDEQQVEAAIRAVRRGETYFSRQVSGPLQQEVMRNKRFRRNFSRFRQISDREMEVLQRICQGQTNREIAAFLELSVRTVDNHRHRLLEKCEAKNTAGLVIYAIRYGLVDVSDL